MLKHGNFFKKVSDCLNGVEIPEVNKSEVELNNESDNDFINILDIRNIITCLDDESDNKIFNIITRLDDESDDDIFTIISLLESDNDFITNSDIKTFPEVNNSESTDDAEIITLSGANVEII